MHAYINRKMVYLEILKNSQLPQLAHMKLKITSYTTFIHPKNATLITQCKLQSRTVMGNKLSHQLIPTSPSNLFYSLHREMETNREGGGGDLNSDGVNIL
jgi:hypothetical protein